MRNLFSILLAVCALVCTPDVGYSSPDIDQGDLITVCDHQVNETMVPEFSMGDFQVFSESCSFYCADELITEAGEAPPLLLKHLERPSTLVIEASKIRHKATKSRERRNPMTGYTPSINSPPLIRFIV